MKWFDVIALVFVFPQMFCAGRVAAQGNVIKRQAADLSYVLKFPAMGGARFAARSAVGSAVITAQIPSDLKKENQAVYPVPEAGVRQKDKEEREGFSEAGWIRMVSREEIVNLIGGKTLRPDPSVKFVEVDFSETFKVDGTWIRTEYAAAAVTHQGTWSISDGMLCTKGDGAMGCRIIWTTKSDPPGIMMEILGKGIRSAKYGRYIIL